MISLLKDAMKVYHYKYFESDEISMGAKPFIVRIIMPPKFRTAS